MPAGASILRTIEECDGAWLESAIGCGPLAEVTTERVGTGQMSVSYRVRLTYADGSSSEPASVVVKLAASDPTSRSTGVGLGIYAREVRFYRELAPRIGDPLARCLLAEYDEAEGWFTLVLEDVAPARQGDQIAGCSVADAALAMRELARLHAPLIGQPGMADEAWLQPPAAVDQALVAQLLPGFLERYGERLAPEHRALCERFVERLDAWRSEPRPVEGLVHGDFRLDNLLFGDGGGVRALTVVDWQTVGWGGALQDASYFLGGGLPTAERREHEVELLGLYHEQLRAQGVEQLDWDTCWSEYRRHAFAGVLMAILAPMMVERTERGDEMFVTMLARHAQHALDLDAEELLPAAAPAPIRPRAAASDEGSHAPGGEELWNESWYFDAVAPDASLGVYVRVGLYPNLGACWYTAFVCSPGTAAVGVVDFAAPLPGDAALRVVTGRFEAEHPCEAPLQRFRVRLSGDGEAHADHSAPLRGQQGEPVPVELDLVWETAGEPYAYRMTTRYEIPCAVTGTVRVGDATHTLAAAPGQRDHSWGPRDWWSMEWLWSAGALEDGTRLHAVELRLPDTPPLAVGYVQPPAGELLELQGAGAAERVGDNGLVEQARLRLVPPGLELALEPLAFGALRLTAPDGRVSLFPRAMCRLHAGDGRTGVGWAEWNLNRSLAGAGERALAGGG